MMDSLRNLDRAHSAAGLGGSFNVLGILRAHDALLHTIYTTVACGIVVQDAEGAILHGNAAAERILGLTLGQMRDRTSLDPRWRATREDGSAFPGAEHPAMVALRTGQEQRNVTMGVALPPEELERWLWATDRAAAS